MTKKKKKKTCPITSFSTTNLRWIEPNEAEIGVAWSMQQVEECILFFGTENTKQIQTGANDCVSILQTEEDSTVQRN